MQITTTSQMLTDVHNGRGDIRQPRATACLIAQRVTAEETDHHVTIRELRPSDAQACEVFFRHLDQHDIRMRFASPRAFSLHHFLPGSGGAVKSLAFGAVDAADTILGIVNLIFLNSDSAEVAIIVRSDHKRHGIGRSLLEHTISRAEHDGVTQLVGYVLAENKPMLALARAMGFRSLGWDSFFIVVSRSVPSTPF